MKLKKSMLVTQVFDYPDLMFMEILEKELNGELVAMISDNYLSVNNRFAMKVYYMIARVNRKNRL